MTWLARYKDEQKQFSTIDEALSSISKALIASSDYSDDCDNIRWCFGHIDEVEELGIFSSVKWSVQKVIDSN